MKKKLLSVLLVGAMAASLLAGCGGSDSDTTPVTGADKEAVQPTSEAAEINMDEDPYEVAIQVVVLPGADFSEIEPKIEAAVNEITLPAINCTVDVQYTSIAELNQITQLAVASQGQDKIDLVAVCTVMTVDNLVGKDLLLDLNENDLLASHGQDILAAVGDAVKVGNIGGQQLTVPGKTFYALNTGLYYNKTMADAAGFTLPEEGTMEDLDKGLYALHAANPDVRCHYAGTGTLLYYPFFYNVETFGTNAMYGAIMDGSTTITNLYESEEFRNYCLKMLQWKKDGLIKESDNSDQTSTQDYIAAGTAFYTPASFDPNAYADYAGKGAASGFETGFMNMTPAMITSQSVKEYMWGIASSSERPDKAMDFLNFIYKEPAVANILKYGIEGENYEKTGESTIQSFFNYLTVFYFCGDQSKMYNIVGEDYVDQCKAFEAESTPSPVFGYIFIDADYQTESAVLTSTIEQYLGRLQTGLFADEAEMDAYLQEFIGALKTAGIDDVIAGNQEQLNAFLGQ